MLIYTQQIPGISGVPWFREDHHKPRGNPGNPQLSHMHIKRCKVWVSEMKLPLNLTWLELPSLMMRNSIRYQSTWNPWQTLGRKELNIWINRPLHIIVHNSTHCDMHYRSLCFSPFFPLLFHLANLPKIPPHAPSKPPNVRQSTLLVAFAACHLLPRPTAAGSRQQSHLTSSRFGMARLALR